MDARPLKTKALECAIKSISYAISPKMANIIYKRWEVFHEDPRFKQVIRNKQLKFKSK